jgi:hypothetical protein
MNETSNKTWGQTLVEVDLTVTECEMLLNLLQDRKAEGSYYGNREQYYRRIDRVKDKIIICLNEL